MSETEVRLLGVNTVPSFVSSLVKIDLDDIP